MISKSSNKFSKRLGTLAGVAFGCVALAAGPAKAAPPQTTQTANAVASVAQSYDTVQAGVPRLVQFNGTLKDSAARPVTGVASVTFAIYSEQDGGTALWSETQNVLADANGRYSVLLGAATANGMPAELFGTGQSRWLGVSLARQQEIPRVLLASVPYALKAADADTLGGLPASAYVTQSLAASNATSSPSVAAFTGGNTTTVATPLAARAALAPSGIPQVTPTGSGTTDFIPIWTSSSALGSSTIFESAGLVGIGTTTPAETLDVYGNSIFRGSFQLPPGHPATASSGYESHSFQFEASSYNSATKLSDTEAFGFRAEPLGNNTSSPSAKLDLLYGPGGGTLTDTGFSFANNGIVTFAAGQTFPGIAGLSSANVFAGTQTVNSTSGDGIASTSSSSGAAGVFGLDTSASGVAYGVYGQTLSPAGVGVAGVNSATTGPAIGIYGESYGSVGVGVYGTGASSGVYGETASAGGSAITGVNASGGLAGNFTGSVAVSGGLTAAVITSVELNLPNTTSTTSGVISIGGNPFVHDFGDIHSTFLGLGAGGALKNVAQSYNTGLGEYALNNIGGGTYDTAIGDCALCSATTGSYDSALGRHALESLTNGSFDSAVGYGAGVTNVTGSYDTLLGNSADVTVDGLMNATAIGANASVGASNSLVLGSINGVNGATASVNVGIGTATPRTGLEISSSAQGTFASPTPTVTMTNTQGGGTVSLDFNTFTPSSTGTYNPASRILALDDGHYSDSIAFFANVDGAPNSGLLETLLIESNGDILIPGNLKVNGTVSKGGGSFKIDDPIDPADKYLSHSFVESPDMMNIYNGNVTTDAHGFATVEMPAWFEALNGDFRYQLTSVGQFAQAMVATEIKDGKFSIRTNKPHVKVSWQVTGVRHDPWANAHRIPTEEAKPADERGRYLHPELYGAPAEMNVSAVHNSPNRGGAQK